jgi:hypothetical protein
MNQDHPVYQDQPPRTGWLNLMFVMVLVVILITGLVLIKLDWVFSLIMFAVALFAGLVFYSVIPRCYQIYSDRLKIILGPPFSITILFTDIRSFWRVDGEAAISSLDIRSITTTRYVIEINRRRSKSIMISPSGGDHFSKQLNQALKDYTEAG